MTATKRNRTGAERTAWAYVRVYTPAVLLTVLGFVFAFQFVDPAPPDSVKIATGGRDGAYFHFATRYGPLFEKQRVHLEAVETKGSVENLALLRDASNDIDLAFVQGGVGKAAESDEELVALGSVYFEPLWVFHRIPKVPTQLRDLRGTRIALSGSGSGTRAVAVQLLKENGVTESNSTFSPLGGTEAAQALANGDVDAVFLVASPASSTVRALLETEGVSVMSFERADAYTRIHPFLSSIILPQGTIDLAKDIPREDIQLLAPTATLVATPRLHPAIIDLVLQAATEVHGRGGVFETFGQFPSPEFIDFPLSDEAKRYYKSGPPFLQRFMPFWAATLVDRMLVMLLPIVALLFPLMRLMPPIYRWRMRARVYRWYKELLATDPTTVGSTGGASVPDRLAELSRIEEEVAKVNVPVSFADQLYHLRLHIDLVRERLLSGDETSGEAAKTPESGQ